MEIEHIYCIYCKRTLKMSTEVDYHFECKQMIQNYNKQLSIKIKNEFIERKNIKYGIYWLFTKYMAYKLIYAIGGINISFIILYQMVIGF